jgi:hypothetical protein
MHPTLLATEQKEKKKIADRRVKFSEETKVGGKNRRRKKRKEKEKKKEKKSKGEKKERIIQRSPGVVAWLPGVRSRGEW